MYFCKSSTVLQEEYYWGNFFRNVQINTWRNTYTSFSSNPWGNSEENSWRRSKENSWNNSWTNLWWNSGRNSQRRTWTGMHSKAIPGGLVTEIILGDPKNYVNSGEKNPRMSFWRSIWAYHYGGVADFWKSWVTNFDRNVSQHLTINFTISTRIAEGCICKSFSLPESREDKDTISEFCIYFPSSKFKNPLIVFIFTEVKVKLSISSCL